MKHTARPQVYRALISGIAIVVIAVSAVTVWNSYSAAPSSVDELSESLGELPAVYRPRESLDTSGFTMMSALVTPWKADASLVDIGANFQRIGYRSIERIEKQLAEPGRPEQQRVSALLMKAVFLNLEGEALKAYEVLRQLRSMVANDSALAQQSLYTIIYFQGVTALRRGENDNCIMCRGETSCILPISAAAVHTVPEGSRLAIEHFTEYLARFPNDLEVRWLLNIAHMTLGEHPHKVDPRFVISLERYLKSEVDIGRFRDIGHIVGVNRLNQAGGGIMDDFDNDGLLDIVTTTTDPTSAMSFFRNTGRGQFENRTEAAGITGQLGGLNCVQTDYNNDGHLDILIVRGAWLAPTLAMRPSLLQNKGDGTFADVTHEAGLAEPVNSIAAAWADYDNDGWLDLFICCERQPNKLYHNLKNGKFEEVAVSAGVSARGQPLTKGVAWIDYDNDGFQDLFLNHLSEQGGRLLRNRGDGTFLDKSGALGIDGPAVGFSCWAWDYNNDGWQDIFATCYERTVDDVVKGLIGQRHRLGSNRLYRNRGGRGFDDVTKAAGLDLVFATMGSNYGDFDNDGFLDMYLGTGDPNLATLVPNRMFKNIDGKRFAEITASSGTGNLQKGHGVACGDWDRDGNVDVFIQMGGVVNGDQYHNILFQNPGHANHWLTVKLVGQKTNRAAVGARIKVVTAPGESQTIHRHISSGSSFGANPFEQTIGLGQAERIALLEIHWPTSGTTQAFRDVAVDQAIEVTEFAENYRKLDHVEVDWRKLEQTSISK
jgi:hypothetical protein